MRTRFQSLQVWVWNQWPRGTNLWCGRPWQCGVTLVVGVARLLRQAPDVARELERWVCHLLALVTRLIPGSSQGMVTERTGGVDAHMSPTTLLRFSASSISKESSYSCPTCSGPLLHIMFLFKFRQRSSHVFWSNVWKIVTKGTDVTEILWRPVFRPMRFMLYLIWPYTGSQRFCCEVVLEVVVGVPGARKMKRSWHKTDKELPRHSPKRKGSPHTHEAGSLEPDFLYVHLHAALAASSLELLVRRQRMVGTSWPDEPCTCKGSSLELDLRHLSKVIQGLHPGTRDFILARTCAAALAAKLELTAVPDQLLTGHWDFLGQSLGFGHLPLNCHDVCSLDHELGLHPTMVALPYCSSWDWVPDRCRGQPWGGVRILHLSLNHGPWNQGLLPTLLQLLVSQTNAHAKAQSSKCIRIVYETDFSTNSLVRCCIASFLSTVNPSCRPLFWLGRSRSMPRPRTWARISLTNTTWLPSPIVVT